jgi:hypothetical protein
MANVLNNLAADIYKAADIVGREQVGLVSAVTHNTGGDVVASIGDVIRSSFTRPVSATTFVPSMSIPEGTDQTVDNKTMTISKQMSVPIPWIGEEVAHVNNGIGFDTIYGDQIVQAMRDLTNKIELDLYAEVSTQSSRAVGTAGTNPFTTNTDLIADGRQVLVENGCPVMSAEMSLIASYAAGTALRKTPSLQKVNEAGNESLLRNGIILPLQGFNVKETAAASLRTKGTGASYTTTTAGFAVGTKQIPLITGTGTINAGDVVTFAGDTNKYVVEAGISAPGTITLGGNGLRQAIPASATAVTVGNSYTGSILLHKGAAELVMRPVKGVGVGKDAAVDSMIIVDPFSNLQFMVATYFGHGKKMIEVSAAWGVKCWKGDFVATILG